MKKVSLFLLAVGLIAIANPLMAQLIELKAEKFIEYITVANPYREWQMWPGKGRFHQGSPLYGHGTLITTYANLTAQKSIKEMKGMADGSIVVTENYDANKILQGITSMYKVKGYNPDGGDWYWVEATPRGAVLNSGKSQPCIDCHQAQAGNDYIWTGEVVKGKYIGMEGGQENRGKLTIDRK